MFPFTYCMYCKQMPADHHGRCCHMKPHKDIKSSENRVKAAGVRHTMEAEECVNKLIPKWRNDAEDTSEQPAVELKEWWNRTHGVGNPNVERLETGPMGSMGETGNCVQEPLTKDTETEYEIKWTTKGSMHYLENYEPNEQTMERMIALVRNYVYVEQSPKMKLEVSWERWKSTRWAINIKSQIDLTKIICIIYVSQHKDGTPRWIMANCKSYKKWAKEMTGLRTFIQGKLSGDSDDVAIANGDHIAEMVGKEISKWITEEKGSFAELKQKEEELKETDNVEPTRAQLERSARKLELYTEMFSETSKQVGRLWGENPAIEWITEMRGREWSSYGPSSDKKVNEAYEKEVEKLKQAVEELIDGTWSTIGTTEAVAPGVSPVTGEE